MEQKNWHDGVFFGLHFDLHANEADTELGKGLTKQHLLSQLSKIRPDFVQCDCKGHPGLTSYPTKVGAAAPGIVQDAVRIWREASRELGIPLVMHYSGVWDTAAIKLHPHWGRVNADQYVKDGAPQGHDLNMTCPLSGYTDHYMIPQLLEIINEYDVDGFWVDGENWASAPCYCERCVTAFLSEHPATSVPLAQGQPLWPEWLAFARQNFSDHVRRYTAAVHQKKPACTVCSNWLYTVRQPEEMSLPVDYLSGDFSWIWSAARATLEARFMDSRGIGYDLMAWGFSSHEKEHDWVFKSAPALCQEAAVVMSCGGSFLIYDTPNRDGSLVSWHMDVLAQVAAFCRARQAYCQDSRPVPQILLLHAAEHYYAANEPLYNLGRATQPLEGALHAFLENSLPVSISSSGDLANKLAGHPLCIVAEQENLQQETIRLLEEYVENGGTLIVSGEAATSQFDKLLGVREKEPALSDQQFYLPAGEGTVLALGQWRQVTAGPDTKELAPLLLSRDSGCLARPAKACAASMRQVKKGRIIGIYGPFFASYSYTHYPALRQFIGQIIGQLDLPGLIKVKAPPRIQISLRERGRQLFVHLVNLSTDQPLSPQSPLVENVPPAGPVQIELPLAGRPASVSLRPGALPINWSWQDGRLLVSLDQIGIHDILVIER